MQLHHGDLIGPDAGLRVGLRRGVDAEVVADCMAHVAREAGRGVAGEALSGNAHPGVQALAAGIALRDEHGGCASAGGRAALQAGQRAVLVRRGQHLIEGDQVAEHRVGVVGGVLSRLHGDSCEGLRGGAELFHVRLARSAEQLRGHRRVRLDAVGGCELGEVRDARCGPVVPVAGQGARAHLLEPERQRDVDLPARHGASRLPQGGGTAGAVVVDVDDGDAGGAHGVESHLTAGRVAVDVGGVCLLDVIDRHTGVCQRGADRPRSQVLVLRAGTGLGEGDHADSGNMHVDRHGERRSLSSGGG